MDLHFTQLQYQFLAPKNCNFCVFGSHIGLINDTVPSFTNAHGKNVSKVLQTHEFCHRTSNDAFLINSSWQKLMSWWLRRPPCYVTVDVNFVQKWCLEMKNDCSPWRMHTAQEMRCTLRMTKLTRRIRKWVFFLSPDMVVYTQRAFWWCMYTKADMHSLYIIAEIIIKWISDFNKFLLVIWWKMLRGPTLTRLLPLRLPNSPRD